MENNQNNELSNFKYNPLTDGGFWAAILICGIINIQQIVALLFSGYFHPSLISGIIFLVSWTGWILYNKGKNHSFMYGFIFGLILFIVSGRFIANNLY